ncbi:MAG: polysaccharide biosynthesis/export family protein [candidate division KSB1 bacterium]|nr:polysaccharide biosynthesis/export family protein [candidate division KSB1 bacterium]MDZ7303571.1 polysaccharide biosynthesis/export family protein [candidate division KSB1 bacterium]MDZ7312814.1 polysaccharide biosynthesis/export family protein [candidate division KSB1 bacterium]
MQPQGWRSLWVVLITCGINLLFIALPPALAQSKSGGSSLEPSSRKVSTLSSGAGDFSPGDGVRIVVWRDFSVGEQGGIQNLGLNDDFLIDNRGYLTLPVIGEMRAIGHTRKSLARAIEDSLSIRGIRVMCSPLIRLTVMGMVNKPGSYLIESKGSLWELINMAEGPANGANINKIYVERSGRVLVENLVEGFQQAHSLEQIGVRSGDQIYVPGISRFNFRTIVDYATLTASFVVLYYQIKDHSR